MKEWRVNTLDFLHALDKLYYSWTMFVVRGQRLLFGYSCSPNSSAIKIVSSVPSKKLVQNPPPQTLDFTTSHFLTENKVVQKSCLFLPFYFFFEGKP